jgi:hypothetical protein
MSIHPAMASRYHLLEGISWLQQFVMDPAVTAGRGRGLAIAQARHPAVPADPLARDVEPSGYAAPTVVSP